MANVATISAVTSAGIGGLSISRWRFTIASGGVPLSTDANSAAAAVAGFYNAVKAYVSGAITWSIEPTFEVLDVVSGAPTANGAVTTIPSPVTGTDSINFPAGVGARVNWVTESIVNRRFVRGATFLVPLGGAAYENTTGAIKAAAQSVFLNAAIAYIAAMSSGSVIPVVYGRPKKGQITGGHTATILGAGVPLTPAGLRSRRS